eukprot:TRINITY_DN23826_c0_g1_i1.p1 TRINITY_DN23826_c0_g1~~TRINITY_DN23826_c0_g1_i1.p1  ORF type:complete len:685 (-),score=89.61 TRINITY_DN23826_c0_g1_i1:223-2277(-)
MALCPTAPVPQRASLRRDPSGGAAVSKAHSPRPYRTPQTQIQRQRSQYGPHPPALPACPVALSVQVQTLQPTPPPTAQAVSSLAKARAHQGASGPFVQRLASATVQMPVQQRSTSRVVARSPSPDALAARPPLSRLARACSSQGAEAPQVQQHTYVLGASCLPGGPATATTSSNLLLRGCPGLIDGVNSYAEAWRSSPSRIRLTVSSLVPPPSGRLSFSCSPCSGSALKPGSSDVPLTGDDMAANPVAPPVVAAYWQQPVYHGQTSPLVTPRNYSFAPIRVASPDHSFAPPPRVGTAAAVGTRGVTLGHPSARSPRSPPLGSRTLQLLRQVSASIKAPNSARPQHPKWSPVASPSPGSPRSPRSPRSPAMSICFEGQSESSSPRLRRRRTSPLATPDAPMSPMPMRTLARKGTSPLEAVAALQEEFAIGEGVVTGSTTTSATKSDGSVDESAAIALGDGSEEAMVDESKLTGDGHENAKQATAEEICAALTEAAAELAAEVAAATAEQPACVENGLVTKAVGSKDDAENRSPQSERPCLSCDDTGAEVGDIVSLGPGTPPEFRGHDAVVTAVADCHCTVAVLDSDRKIVVGECWPNLSDLTIVHGCSGRLGMRVVVRGLKAPRHRHFNGLAGTIVRHPQQGHPCFISKARAPDEALLVFCVAVDNAPAGEGKFVLLELQYFEFE